MTKMGQQEGTNSIALAINNNPEFAATLVSFLNPKTIANIMNTSISTTTALLNELDRTAVANTIGNSGAFINGLLGALDVAVITDALKTPAGAGFLTAMFNPDPSTGGMDPRVMAQNMNQNSRFSENLMNELAKDPNPDRIVQIVNTGGPFLKSLIGNLDASVINAASGASEDTMKALVKELDPVKIASIINDLSVANFVGVLMGRMDPTKTAQVLSTSDGQTFLNAVLSQIQNDPDPAARNNLAAILSNPAGVEMTHQLYLALADPSVLNDLVSKINAAGENSVLRWLTLKTKAPVGSAFDVPGLPGLKVQISDERQYVVPLEVAVREYPLPW
jgi:hypothetical protein